MASSVAMVLNLGLRMVQNIKETLSMAKSREKENLSGKMEIPMRDSGSTIKLMA